MVSTALYASRSAGEEAAPATDEVIASLQLEPLIDSSVFSAAGYASNTRNTILFGILEKYVPSIGFLNHRVVV